MKKLDTRSITALGLLVAVEIVLSRFCSINAWDLKIGFSFLPVAVAAMRLGPLEAAVVAAVSDFVGAVLFPIGAYFPGFTLTAFLSAEALRSSTSRIGRFFTDSNFSSTASLVSARIQSKRRITVRGRITSPYSWGLYTPVNLSAIAQIRAAFSLTLALRLMLLFLPFPLEQIPEYRPHRTPTRGRFSQCFRWKHTHSALSG